MGISIQSNTIYITDIGLVKEIKDLNRYSYFIVSTL